MFTETCMGGDGVGLVEIAIKHPPADKGSFNLHSTPYRGKKNLIIIIGERDATKKLTQNGNPPN